MNKSVFKYETSDGLLTHICKVMDNEYNIILREIQSRMTALSDITKNEILAKLE